MILLFTFCFATKGETVDESLSRLSLKQKVGQIFIFGFKGTTPETSLLDAIQTYEPGALIAFRRNVQSLEQIARLNRAAQAKAAQKTGVPLLIMVDQEGGNVTRLRVNSPLPSALALGQTRDPLLIQRYGEVMGQLMYAVGFNMNLAPVLDLSDPNTSSFVGPRSFGIHPENVAVMAKAFSRGLAMGGVMPTAKHFPGHGGLTEDSHRETPVKHQSLEELEAKDLVPFRKFFAADFPKAVMMAHISFPKVDSSGVPSGFSKIFIRDILRKRYRYDGLIVTDDLEMSGAEKAGGLDERVVKAFEAGNDMIMVAWSPSRQKQAFEALHQAVLSKRISEERLNESVRRILAHKLEWPTRKSADLSVAKSELEKLSRQVQRYNFVRAAAKLGHLRGVLGEKPSLTVYASDAGFYRSFQTVYGTKAKFNVLTPDTMSSVGRKISSVTKRNVSVFYALGLQTARWLASLSPEAKQNLIVVNTNQAGALANPESFLGVYQLNTPSSQSGAWIAEHLTREPPQLRIPSADVQETKSQMPEKDLPVVD